MNSREANRRALSRPARRTLAQAGGLVACALTLSALVSAEPPGSKPGIKTDRATYLPVPAVKLPKACGTFVDPTFGTEILRVTDAADGAENQNAYSYWPSFNKDATKFFVCSGGRAMLYHFDPDRFRILGKEPLFPEKPPEGGWPGWEDAIWSGASPDLLFCHSGLRLWSYNVQTRQYTLVRDFKAELSTGHLRQMSKSLDDRVFGFTRQDAKYAVVGYLVWDRPADRLLLNQHTRQLDEIQVDKSGQFCVIKTGQGGKGVVEVRVADLRTGKVEDLVDNEPDYAPGHSDNGHGIVIGADNWKNRITFRRLDDPHRVRTVLDLGNDWSQDYHVSLLADDERWALVSFYVGNKLRSSGVFQNEIIQVATDGSQRVRRLAHHRSVVKEYWDSPRANLSRDGRFVIFTSNVEGRGQRDVFILKVPPPDRRGSP